MNSYEWKYVNGEKLNGLVVSESGILLLCFLPIALLNHRRETTHRIHACYIYGNIYHQYTPNVSIYTIHGSYG